MRRRWCKIGLKRECGTQLTEENMRFCLMRKTLLFTYFIEQIFKISLHRFCSKPESFSLLFGFSFHCLFWLQFLHTRNFQIAFFCFIYIALHSYTTTAAICCCASSQMILQPLAIKNSNGLDFDHTIFYMYVSVFSSLCVH